MSNAELSSSPSSVASGVFEALSDATTLTTYVPFGTDVVSHTKIVSVRPLFSDFQAVSPSRR